MTKRIKLTSSHQRTIISTSSTAPRIDPGVFGKAVGGEPIGPRFGGASGSPGLADLRRRMVIALKSHGGRPGIEGAVRRQKIPMSDQDWERLQAISASLATETATPTAGQVASQLLHDAIHDFGRGARTFLSSPMTGSIAVSEPPRAPYVGAGSIRAGSPESQAARERVLVAQHGRPVALIVGVEAHELGELFTMANLEFSRIEAERSGQRSGRPKRRLGKERNGPKDA